MLKRCALVWVTCAMNFIHMAGYQFCLSFFLYLSWVEFIFVGHDPCNLVFIQLGVRLLS